MTRSTITRLLCLAFIGTAVAEPPVLHDWRSTSGATTKAVFFSFDEGKAAVVLLIPRTVPLSQLAPQSADQAKRLAAAEAQAQDDGDLRAELEQTRQQLAEMTAKYQQALRGQLAENREGQLYLQDDLDVRHRHIELLQRNIHAAERRYLSLSPGEQGAVLAAVEKAKAEGPQALSEREVGLLYYVGSLATMRIADEATGKTYDDAQPAE